MANEEGAVKSWVLAQIAAIPGLTEAVLRTVAATLTAPLGVNGQKVANVGTATDPADAVRLDQMQAADTAVGGAAAADATAKANAAQAAAEATASADATAKANTAETNAKNYADGQDAVWYVAAVNDAVTDAGVYTDAQIATRQPVNAGLTSLAGLNFAANPGKAPTVKSDGTGYELTTPGGGAPTIVSVSDADQTVTAATSTVVIYTALTAQRTVTLFAPGTAGRIVEVVDGCTSATEHAAKWPIRIQTASGTISGRTEVALCVQQGTLSFRDNGTNWVLLGGPSAWLPEFKRRDWPIDAPPTTPHSTDDEFCGLTGQSSPGTTMAAKWTLWAGTSGTTWTIADGVLTARRVGATNYNCAYVQNVSNSVDLTYTTKLSPWLYGATDTVAGLIMAKGTSSDPMRAFLIHSSPSYADRLNYLYQGWNSQTSWSTNYSLSTVTKTFSAIYMRIRVTSGTWYAELSHDGISWYLVYSEAKPWADATVNVGMVASYATSTLDRSMNFHWFRKTA